MLYQKKKIPLLFEDETYKINGVLFEVHREIGRFAKEKQYADLLEKKLKEKDIPFKRELRVGDTGNIFDFLIGGNIIVELKAKPFLTKQDYFQLKTYLQSVNLKLGLLVNFRSEYLKPQRVLHLQAISSVDISGSVTNP